MLRGTNSEPFQTGFIADLTTPRIATSGALTIGVKPVWNGAEFVPRLLLPLSVSYDHRVVDGALAARFTTHLAGVLKDMRRALL